MCDGLLDSNVDILQHFLLKVFVSIHTLQVFLELLFKETKEVKELTFFFDHSLFKHVKVLVNRSAYTAKPLTFSASLSEHPTNSQIRSDVETHVLCVT